MAAGPAEAASMSDKPALQPIIGEYYSNILLLDPSKNPLTTISARRARWYLDKSLAVSLGPDNGYSDRLMLTFAPKKSHSNSFLQAILPTQCVVCGANDGLTLHHVIPMAVKRFFPEKEKNHTRQWCVLVCEKHHLEAEKLCRPLYEHSLQDAIQAVQKQHSDKNKLFYKLMQAFHAKNAAIQHLRNALNEEELEIAGAFLDSSAADETVFDGLKCIVENVRAENKMKVKETKARWGNSFIEVNGGIENVKKMFREAFLNLNPQFLPEGFLVDYENLN